MKYTNKQRCLVLASRGVNYRTRHLMKDLESLMPHHKPDVKVFVVFISTDGLAGHQEGTGGDHGYR